jgi:signal transduction histidine kinase
VRSVPEVCDVLLTRGASVLEAQRGYVALEADGDLKIVAARGFTPPAEAWLRQAIHDESPVAYSVRTGRPVWIRSAAEYRRRFAGTVSQVGVLSDVHAHVSLPLWRDGALVGAMGFSFASATAFGAVDRAFTRILAHLAGDALARAAEHDCERSRREAAEGAIAAREELLRVVAHDLRNPLNLISMTSQLLEELDPPAERRKELLQVVGRATRSMSRLVQDLLDAARVEAGTFSLKLEEVQVGPLLENELEMFISEARAKEITLRAEYPSAALRVCADRERLMQMLGNLVANALKFAGAGSTVVLGASSEAGAVDLTVSDNGPGLSKEEQGRLFHPYWQADSRDRRGLGLGLFIVKRLVDAHGGAISVQSEPGRGASFTIRLPSGNHS